jgi:catechol 2,3-dioxygenase-like lactoylglutathione lyase family enzyme
MKLVELAIFTDKVSEMGAYYHKLLGEEPVAQSGDMVIFMSGDTKIFIHRLYTPEKGELPPENHMAFTVQEVDAFCQQLEAQGLFVEIQPQDYYWGRSAYLRDPMGQLIELIQED